MFFHNLVPFIGFGFFDNLLMILAGDLIETQIGATMHLSVMACAALGNTISDVCGIGLAGYVEVLALRMGLPVPDLPQAQLNHTRVRRYKSVKKNRLLMVFIGSSVESKRPSDGNHHWLSHRNVPTSVYQRK